MRGFIWEEFYACHSTMEQRGSQAVPGFLFNRRIHSQAP